MGQTLSSNKTIARNTIYLYARMAFTMLISLYTVRVVLAELGVEDYGLYNAVGGVVTSLSFLTAVLSNASNRFFSIEIGKGANGKLNTYFNTILTTYICIAVIIFLVIEFGGMWLLDSKMTIPADRQSVVHFVLHMSLLTFVVTVLSSPFQSLLISYEEMNIYALVSIFESLAKLGVVFLLSKSSYDKLATYSFLILVIAVINSFAYYFFCKRKCNIKINFKLDRNIFLSILNYSSWTLFGTFSGVVCIQGSCILLNIYSGPVANAAFAIAIQISNAIQNFSSSFYTAVRPPLIKGYAAGDFIYTNQLFRFSNKVLFILTFAIVFPLFTEIPFILDIWLSKDNVSMYMVDFVRIMTVYALIICMSNPITTIVQAAGKVKMYHGFVDGFAMLFFPVSYILFALGISKNPSTILLMIVAFFSIAHLIRLFVLEKVSSLKTSSYMTEFLLPVSLVVLLCIVLYYVVKSFIPQDMFGHLCFIFIEVLVTLLSSFILLFNKEERLHIISLAFKKSIK